MTITYEKPDFMPDALFNAIAKQRKERLPGIDYTVTELLAPARAAQLLRTHDVTVSAVEKLWALIGSGLHKMLDNGAEHEVTMIAELDGVRISGTADMIDQNRVIHDWKLCSVWAWIFGLKEEWEQQLNCYAWLYRNGEHSEGLEPSDLRVNMIFRDWHKSKANGIDYPANELHSVSVLKWDDKKAEEFLRGRIKAHQAAKSSLPSCTDSERWYRAGGVAVMKKGRKSALRVLATEAEARAWAEREGSGGLYLETRPGKDVRCLGWCAARSVCDYAQRLQQIDEETT